MPETDFASRLREGGHKVTDQRRRVWETLRSTPGHATADAVAVRSGVNIASVYRALSLFAELGIARESKLGMDDAARWEVAHPDDEFHLVCQRCGSVEHHGGDLVDQIRHHLNDGHGFRATSIELAVSGLCVACNS